jgi:hypothetical protein
MRSHRLLIIPSAFCLAVLLIAQLSPLADAKPSFAGTWEGKINDLPAINLKIEDTNGKISGVMTFDFQERSDTSAPWHVTSENPGLC